MHACTLFFSSSIFSSEMISHSKQLYDAYENEFCSTSMFLNSDWPVNQKWDWFTVWLVRLASSMVFCSLLGIISLIYCIRRREHLVKKLIIVKSTYFSSMNIGKSNGVKSFSTSKEEKIGIPSLTTLKYLNQNKLAGLLI